MKRKKAKPTKKQTNMNNKKRSDEMIDKTEKKSMKNHWIVVIRDWLEV